MPPCNGEDTGCARSMGNITRRASGLTSLRCLGTRMTEESVEKVMQMAVDVFHWCYLPRKGIDFCLVSCAYSTPKLPLIPGESCHRFHAKAATCSTRKLPL